MRRRKAPHSGKRPTLKGIIRCCGIHLRWWFRLEVSLVIALFVFLLLAVAGVLFVRHGLDFRSALLLPALCIAAFRALRLVHSNYVNTLKTWIELSKKVSTRIRKKMGKMASKKSRDSKDDSDTQYPYAA